MTEPTDDDQRSGGRLAFVRRHRRLVVAAAVLLVAAAALAVLRSGDDGDGPPSFGTDDAEALVDAVNSRDPGRLADVLVLGDVDAEDVAEDMLPPEAEITIDVDTFTAASGEQPASVEVTITGPTEVSSTVYLVHQDGRWRMIGSTPPGSS